MSTTGRNVFLVVTVMAVLTLVTLNHYTGLITDDHSHVTLLQKIETHQHLDIINSSRPHPVLLVCYFRSGSSFLGQLLANAPEAFYVFEPLFPILTSIYGHPINPSTHFYKTGTLVKRPSFEVTEVASHITSLLTCQMENLPVEFFFHYFRFGADGASLRPYKLCMNSSKGCDKECNKLLSGVCVGASEMCAQRVKQARYCQGDNNTCTDFNTDPQNKPFIERQSCLTACRTEQFTPCQHIMQNICDSSGLKVSKVIRMQMSYVEEILSGLPEVKVIHLVRDPRGILMSQDGLSKSGMSDTKWEVQANNLCQRITLDLDVSSLIQTLHPSSLLSIRYEDLASDPPGVADTIYHHIGQSVPDRVRHWIYTNTHGKNDNGKMGTRRKNSTAQAYHWMDDITERQLKRVMEIPDCVDVIKRLGYSSRVELEE